jgi:hypothetical protein
MCGAVQFADNDLCPTRPPTRAPTPRPTPILDFDDGAAAALGTSGSAAAVAVLLFLVHVWRQRTADAAAAAPPQAERADSLELTPRAPPRAVKKSVKCVV